ncbi:MAG: hypothetical protein AAF664_14140, partial [Planctomycetota bacterium]
MHRKFVLSLVFVTALAGGHFASVQADEAQTLTSQVASDTFKDLPADHVVGIGPDGVATIELDTMGIGGFTDATVSAFNDQGLAVDAVLR